MAAHPGWRRLAGPSTKPLALDAVALILLVLAGYIVSHQGPQDTSANGFFGQPLPGILVLAGACAAIAAGVLATIALRREPLRSRRGRWATRLALVSALLVPAIAIPVATIAWLAGIDLPDDWGQPLAPLWILTVITAVGLGAFCGEARQRGLLILPAVVGAFVLTFLVGEILVAH